jgi:hypothetical protein
MISIYYMLKNCPSLQVPFTICLRKDDKTQFFRHNPQPTFQLSALSFWMAFVNPKGKSKDTSSPLDLFHIDRTVSVKFSALINQKAALWEPKINLSLSSPV